MDYEAYEKKCNEIRAKNKEYLEIFREDIKKLSPKTIENHIMNVDLFLDDYLLRYDAVPMEDGIGDIGGFLGDFYISKCMWSTPANLKTTAASIKKFYKSMMEHGFITKIAYNDLIEDIKENLEDWQERCRRFNDPDEYDEWFF